MAKVFPLKGGTYHMRGGEAVREEDGIAAEAHEASVDADRIDNLAELEADSAEYQDLETAD